MRGLHRVCVFLASLLLMMPDHASAPPDRQLLVWKTTPAPVNA